MKTNQTWYSNSFQRIFDDFNDIWLIVDSCIDVWDDYPFIRNDSVYDKKPPLNESSTKQECQMVLGCTNVMS